MEWLLQWHNVAVWTFIHAPSMTWPTIISIHSLLQPTSLFPPPTPLPCSASCNWQRPVFMHVWMTSLPQTHYCEFLWLMHLCHLPISVCQVGGAALNHPCTLGQVWTNGKWWGCYQAIDLLPCPWHQNLTCPQHLSLICPWHQNLTCFHDHIDYCCHSFGHLIAIKTNSKSVVISF